MAIPLQVQLMWAAVTRFTGPSLFRLPPEQLREASDKRARLMQLPGATRLTGRPHPDVHVVTKSAIGPDGARIPVRVYRPAGALGAARALVLNFHGGGWVSGDPLQSEWWCSSVAHGADAVVVSVDYRLAPEHPYPAAAEDCYAATAWAVGNAADLGADGGRVAVMGDSAGGNLAAVVALMARDRGGPRLAFQLLIYPAVDLVNSYPSEQENAEAPVLGKDDLQAHRYYCPGRESEPYASPLFADHAGLPPALIQTAHHDPLRDQGAACAAALQRAGVPARLTDYVDAVHGYISIPGVVPAARQALAEAVAALREALPAAPTTPPLPGPEPQDFPEQKRLE